MKMNLNEQEIRILGSLMEKELTSPENYPLTLNALVAACNQKSNREPVLVLTEHEVLGALQSLGLRGLARLTTTGGRVGKYCHSVAGKLGLAAPARATLTELMLRGPQTAGELRARVVRMVEIADQAAVEALLWELRRCAPPMVAILPRQPGKKEERYGQLFAGPPDWAAEEATPPARGEGGEAPRKERLAALQRGVEEMRGEISTLSLEIKELLALFS
jgi:uncharacterized protein YceH (UPF0502 family)